MNNAVKSEKLLSELKDNLAVAGLPEFKNDRDGFYDLCNYVTEWMLRKYDLEHDDEINRGYCFIWAYLVWALWPHGGVTFKTSTGHVVVVKDGLYYDSEHTDGHSVLSDFCGFYREDHHIGIQWMCWFWARNGRQLKEFRRLIRKTNPKLYKLVRDNANAHWNNSVEDFYSWEYLGKLPVVA